MRAARIWIGAGTGLPSPEGFQSPVCVRLGGLHAEESRALGGGRQATATPNGEESCAAVPCRDPVSARSEGLGVRRKCARRGSRAQRGAPLSACGYGGITRTRGEGCCALRFPPGRKDARHGEDFRALIDAGEETRATSADSNVGTPRGRFCLNRSPHSKISLSATPYPFLIPYSRESNAVRDTYSVDSARDSSARRALNRTLGDIPAILASQVGLSCASLRRTTSRVSSPLTCNRSLSHPLQGPMLSRGRFPAATPHPKRNRRAGEGRRVEDQRVALGTRSERPQRLVPGRRRCGTRRLLLLAPPIVQGPLHNWLARFGGACAKIVRDLERLRRSSPHGERRWLIRTCHRIERPAKLRP